jgi:hypothetical protein
MPALGVTRQELAKASKLTVPKAAKLPGGTVPTSKLVSMGAAKGVGRAPAPVKANPFQGIPKTFEGAPKLQKAYKALPPPKPSARSEGAGLFGEL